MRRLLAAVAVAFLSVSASGCIVTSVYPYYSDATVTFESTLLGQWLDDDGKTIWTFEKEGEKAYRVRSAERVPGPTHENEEPESTTLIVHLFRLDDSLFVDAFPAQTGDLSVGGHFLARIEIHGDTLTMRVLDVEAFDRVKGERGGLLHVHCLDNGTIAQSAGGPGFAGTLLLAPTSELQAFLKEHGASVFESELDVLKRQK